MPQLVAAIGEQIDLTKAIKAGQVNEIMVGIKDAWYGRTADPDRPLKLRKTFNLPVNGLDGMTLFLVAANTQSQGVGPSQRS